MIRRALLLAGGLVMAAGIMATPVLARKSDPTPAGIWVDLHFKSAAGKTRTVVVPLQLYKLSQAQTECSDPKHLAGLVKGAIIDDPTVAQLTFVGANCETDPKGAPKVTLGSWPAGRGPGYTEAPGWSINVQPDLLSGAPAVVVLHFIATNGRHVNTVFGYSTKAAFYMNTCAAKLQGHVPAFIAAAQNYRVATASPGDKRPYGLFGLKFIGAECVAPPHQIGDLGWPNASVEWSSLPPGIN